MNIKSILLKIVLVFFLGLILLPGELPDNTHFEQFLKSRPQEKVIIVFNSGGWGNTPLDKAKDFSPIIEELREELAILGYSSQVISYERTKNNFLGKVNGVREILTSFPKGSLILSRQLSEFARKNPDTRIMVTGLSGGGVFVDKVMERLSEENIKNIYAIEAGVPFWEKTLTAENILVLNNEDRDPLSAMDLPVLFSSMIKAPFKWIWGQLSGNSISLSLAFHAPGHDYIWDSPYTGPKVVSFLMDNF